MHSYKKSSFIRNNFSFSFSIIPFFVEKFKLFLVKYGMEQPFFFIPAILFIYVFFLFIFFFIPAILHVCGLGQEIRVSAPDLSVIHKKKENSVERSLWKLLRSSHIFKISRLIKRNTIYVINVELYWSLDSESHIYFTIKTTK